MTDGILQTTRQSRQTPESVNTSAVQRTEKNRSPINIVIDFPERTSCHWGLSPPERKLFDACIHLLRQKGCGVFVTVEHHKAGDDEARRELFRLVKSYVAKFQREKGMARRWYVEVLESVPSLHSHLIVVMPTAAAADWLICRLLNSKFAERLKKKGCKRIWNWEGLRDYLLGEATSQTWHGVGKAFPRVPGSRSGEMTGDRVRPSRDVEKALLARGDIRPRTRTYAKSEKPRKRKPKALVQPIQLDLPITVPAVPILRLVEDARKERGLSQREVARLLGIRQPAYSNAIVRGHDRLGPWAVNRALEFVADRLAA